MSVVIIVRSTLSARAAETAAITNPHATNKRFIQKPFPQPDARTPVGPAKSSTGAAASSALV